MKKKQIICLIDFDNVIIQTDSLFHIFIKEKLYFKKTSMLFLGVLLFLFLPLPPLKQLTIRNEFKKRLLIEIRNLSKIRLTNYITYFKSKINKAFLNNFNPTKYDKVIIISASEENIIKSTLDGILCFDKIIANNMNQTDKFETCWNENKIKLLRSYLGDLKNYDFELYTDSFDDKPLMKVSNKVFMIIRTKRKIYDEKSS